MLLEAVIPCRFITLPSLQQACRKFKVLTLALGGARFEKCSRKSQTFLDNTAVSPSELKFLVFFLIRMIYSFFFFVLQLHLSAQEMQMMIDLASSGQSGNPGCVTFNTFLRIAEMTQWY